MLCKWVWEHLRPYNNKSIYRVIKSPSIHTRSHPWPSPFLQATRCQSLPGSSVPVRTPLLGTHTRSSRTWGSSRWGSGWHGCMQPGAKCTQCGNMRSPRWCIHTGCSDQSPENTIPPQSICCRWPRRCFPAVRRLRSQNRPVRKAVVPKRPCVFCAQRKGAHWKPCWFIWFALSKTKKVTKKQPLQSSWDLVDRLPEFVTLLMDENIHGITSVLLRQLSTGAAHTSAKSPEGGGGWGA